MTDGTTKMSELAMNECILELRAACRRPVDQPALETIRGWVQPDFERILDRLDGKKRWADVGPRVRETGRHLGALADFFASHTNSPIVGIEELTQAVKMVRADCTVRAERTPVAWEFCPRVPVDIRAAQEFLRTMAPAAELASRAS
jgi:hypothetical protein